MFARLCIMHKDERERAILEAALEVFSRRGYTETRMAEIAQAAGISYGLLYHYFSDKEALFETLAEEWWRGFHGILEEMKGSSLSTRDKLVQIVKHVFAVYGRQPQLISLYVKEISRGFAYRRPGGGRERFNLIFDLVSELMTEGQQNGALRSDIPSRYLSYIFLGAIDAFLSVMVLGGEVISKKREKRALHAIMEVFVHGACSESGEPVKSHF